MTKFSLVIRGGLQLWCGILAVSASLALFGQEETTEKNAGYQGSCRMGPLFLPAQFLNPKFLRAEQIKPEFGVKDIYQPEFVKPEIIAPEFVQANFTPRQYLGCSGNRYKAVEAGYKVELMKPGPMKVKAPAPPTADQSQLASYSKPTSFQYTPPPPKKSDCCGGELKLPVPAPAATPASPNAKIN